MRIGIEASAYYKNIAGTGVCLRNIVNTWEEDLGNEYLLFLFSSKRPSVLDLHQKRNVLFRIINGMKEVFWMQVILPLQLKRNRIDILFSPSFLTPIFSRCPNVVTFLDMSFIRYPENVDKLFLFHMRTLLPMIKKKANAILTISEFSKEEIVERLKVPEEKVHVVRLACDDRYQVIDDKNQILRISEKYGLSDPFILNVGTLEPRKNITTLISAFGNLKRRNLIDKKLVLCGPRGWYYKSIFEKIEELKLEKDVILLGYVPDEDLPSLYNAAHMFVYPSYYEGFGLPVLEAMSCGCPVITSNTSALPELVGNAGILIDPTQTEELEHAILRLNNEDDLRKNLGQRGLEQAKLFSRRETAKKTLAILENVFHDSLSQ